ncbi:ExbBD family outer membrane transport energizer [Oleiphilus messinensis]|uniref:ExbBD family outer membrane transport energizer n=1 Tax=Oleiphilus messinensis TaxID=141451 RepID=A0A1Y0I5Z4_9GAMM|nr:MotA/TolQ/ExbB proton channel family protein [Oleiphilus messinensis]ARU55629.1 ExbBD family outer membrane transport energizer [Oleiphilus messinensis]
MRHPPLAAFIGLVIVLLAIVLSADSPLVFLNLPGLAIIIGGITTSLIFSYSKQDLLAAYQDAKQLMKDLPIDKEQTIKDIDGITQLWYRHDLRNVERVLPKVNNSLLNTGVQMVIDRRTQDEINSVLNWKIQQYRNIHLRRARIFQSMSMYAPAFGMVGTLLGLVNMMLIIEGNNNASIAGHLAVALVTTFYGLIFSNLLFKPMAIKMERRIDQTVEWMGVVRESVLLIEQRKSPAFVRQMISTLNPLQEEESRESERVAERKPVSRAATATVLPQS